jgi:hypothetical protein
MDLTRIRGLVAQQDAIPNIWISARLTYEL